MAVPMLSSARALLLAVHLASETEISALRKLIAQERKALRVDIVLRILLTHLPETLPSSEYVPLLEDLLSGSAREDSHSPIDSSCLSELTEKEAFKKVKKLYLLPLAWPNIPADAPEDPFVHFLIHRALRVDQCTGTIIEIPDLLAPFLHMSSYLRTWLISNVLPLLRLSYQYYPEATTVRLSHV